MINELSEPEKKTGMVEQLGREVCNIWYYVARKKMTWLKAILHMQFEIKKKRCWGIMLKKLKRGLRACRLKMGGGGVTSCDIKQSKNYLSHNYNKKQFHRSFSVSFISSNTSANNQPKFNSPYSRYNLYF